MRSIARLILNADPSLIAAEIRTGNDVEFSWQHSWPWPAWMTILIMLAAAAVVLMVYWRDRGSSRSTVRLALAGMRISWRGLVAFMMYGWVMNRQRTDQPDLVIAVDVSESMSVQDHYRPNSLQTKLDRRVERVGLNSATRINLTKSLLLDNERGWLDTLAKQYHLKSFYLGNDAGRQPDTLDHVKDDLRQREADDPASRLGINLLQILQSQRGRPTAAIIVITDGVTTSGATLAEAAEFARQRVIPLHIVGMGNETPPRDAWVSDLLTDDAVFVGDVVHFDFNVRASGYAKQSAIVQLRQQDSDRVLAQQSITFAADDRPQPIRLTHRPGEVGVVDFVVELLPLDGEINIENNRLTKQVDVRDATIRVLIVQSYPSYEFRALRDLLSRAVKSERNSDKAVELTTILQTADVEHADQDATARTDVPFTREALFAYDVVIFGDVNPAFLGNSIMENLANFVTDRGGGLVILNGSQFTPRAYRDTPLAPLFPFAIETAVAPDAANVLIEPFRLRPTLLGAETSYFQLGDSPAASESLWDELDTMYWLHETPDVKPAARVLAVHPTRTSNDGRPRPAIIMQFVGAGKVIAHNVDETYRWSRREPLRQHYARYWLQMLRYLSRGKLLSEDETTQLLTDRTEYRIGDPVRISLRRGSDATGFADEIPVTVTVQHDNGNRQDLVLSGESVHGTVAGTLLDLEPGTYIISLASPQLTPPPASQTIRVISPHNELANLQMNVADLKLAAKRSRGRFYSIAAADRLLRNLPRGRQVPIESLPVIPIWNSSLVAGLFVALITLEWLLRKRAGMI